MNVFHRSCELPCESAPESGTTRRQITSWSFYDASSDETTVVTLSALVTTRITLSTSTDTSAGLVGCEWRFLLLPGASSTPCVHTRFCFMGCTPPVMALRGQGGVVFLDGRHVLVLVGARDTPCTDSAPALDCFTLHDPSEGGTPGDARHPSQRWVRATAAVPLSPSSLPSPAAVPLLVSTVRQCRERRETEVLCVTAAPCAETAASSSSQREPHSKCVNLTATVLRVSVRRGASAPATECAYTCAQRGIVWPNCTSSPDVRDEEDACSMVQEWEWVWVPGHASSSVAPAPVSGALIAVAPHVLLCSGTGDALGSAHRRTWDGTQPAIVCAGPLTGADSAAAGSPSSSHSAPLAVGVTVAGDDVEDVADAALDSATWGSHVAASTAARTVRIMSIGHPSTPLTQHAQAASSSRAGTHSVREGGSIVGGNSQSTPFLLHWVLDYVVNAMAPPGPPLSPGLYVTDLTRSALERSWRKAERDNNNSSQPGQQQPLRDGMAVRVDEACTWDGLRPINLASLGSVLPLMGHARVALALSHTSWTTAGDHCARRLAFRCFIGSDYRQLCMHCFYCCDHHGETACLLTRGHTPLLAYHSALLAEPASFRTRQQLPPFSDENVSLAVEQLSNRLTSVKPPDSARVSATALEHWAWETATAAAEELWQWCFQLSGHSDDDDDDGSAESGKSRNIAHLFLSCLDAQLTAHPFTIDAPAPVHAQHVVTLAYEAVAHNTGDDGGAVEAAKAFWARRGDAFLVGLQNLVTRVDTLACEQPQAELVRQLLLLLLGGGTRPEEQRIHVLVQPALPRLCSARRKTLLFLYATTSRDSESALELMVSDILITNEDDDDNGALMMMEYALLQCVDDAAVFHTLQRLACVAALPDPAVAAGGIACASGVLDVASLKSLFAPWQEPQLHLAEVLTPSLVSIPFFVDCCCCTDHGAAIRDERDAAALAEMSWQRWASRLADGAPLRLPLFLLREEVTDWQLFPWCMAPLAQVLAGWRLLLDRWQTAVRLFKSSATSSAVADGQDEDVVPSWVTVGRRHWSLLTRVGKGVDVLQRLSSLSATSTSVLDDCLRREFCGRAPAFSSWSVLLDVDPPAVFTGGTTNASGAVTLDTQCEVILGRLFHAASKWRCVTDGKDEAPWTLRTWEQYVVSAEDHMTVAVCAEAVLAALAATEDGDEEVSQQQQQQQSLLYFRVCRSIYAVVLPRLLALAGGPQGEAARAPKRSVAGRGAATLLLAPASSAAGECCQRLLQCLQHRGPCTSRLPCLELLAQLTAVQPSVGELVCAGGPGGWQSAVGAAASAPPPFHLSFPSLYVVACLASNRRAVVTLAEVVRLDMRRFVSDAIAWESADGHTLDNADGVKAFMNDQVERLEPYTDVLSQSPGGDPLCEPLVRLVFLECLHDALSRADSPRLRTVMACLGTAVQRVCAPLRRDERCVVRSALTSPFNALLADDADRGDAAPPAHTPSLCAYAAHPFHHLVQARLAPQVARVAARCTVDGDARGSAAARAAYERVMAVASGPTMTSQQQQQQRTSLAVASNSTASLRLLQEEEAFVRRRLTASLEGAHAAFFASPPFWEAVQHLYMALRLEGYRRALLGLATQQKDMSFTLFSAELQRLHSTFKADQRQLLIDAGERVRASHGQVLRDEKAERRSIEEAAIDSLQRLYLDASVPGRPQRQPAPHGDYVAEAGSAIFGALSSWQKKLVNTVAPPPKAPLPTPPPQREEPVGTVGGNAQETDDWGWASDSEQEERTTVTNHHTIEPLAGAATHCLAATAAATATATATATAAVVETQDGWGWSESEDSKASAAQEPTDDGWGWDSDDKASNMDTHAPAETDGWDWPAEAAPVENPVTETLLPSAPNADRDGGDDDDDWGWGSSDSLDAFDHHEVDLATRAFHAHDNLVRAQQQRDALFEDVL